MTPRMFLSYALISGISYSEARELQPGLILDMFTMKHRYDMAHRARL